MEIGAVVLGAGRSERFAGNKLSTMLGNTMLINYPVADLLRTDVSEILVVVNPDFDCAKILQDKRVTCVVNERFVDGKASSIKLAVSLAERKFDGLLFTNADMPLFGSRRYAQLIEYFRENPGKIIAATTGMERRNPCIFPSSFYDDLAALRSEEGGREILARMYDVEIPYVVDHELALMDVDTEADLEKAKDSIGIRDQRG